MRHYAGKKPGGSEDSMHRTKLGLFGTSRPAANADDHQPHDRTLPVEHLELLAGLTPVERATAEAMLRNDAIAA
ncbi:hypothetical protein D9601_12775 [Sphingomonas sp. MA1305]|nr:hypothetical protein [Sphingomonas sp. MA1305]